MKSETVDQTQSVQEELYIKKHTPGKKTVLVWLRENIPFYITAIILTLSVSTFYLLSQYAGGNWAWIGLPLDDNWIHLVYAKSFAESGWFHYNPGEAEAGTSSPLWVVVLGIAYKILTPLNVTPQWCAKGLSLFFAIGVSIIVFHLARTLKLELKWAWIAGILVILEPNLAYGNVSGMEVSMFTFLTLLALLLSWQNRYVLTGIILGLLVITRGEGALTAVVIGLFPLAILYYNEHSNVKLIDIKEIKLGVKIFSPSLILGMAWVFYNYTVSGYILPNTYYVKHNFSLGYFNFENSKNVILGYLGHLSLFKGILLPLTILLFIAALYALYQKKQLILGMPLVLIPLIQLYAFSINIKVVAVETPWTYFTRRYMDFLIPLWILLIVVGIAFLWKCASQSKNRHLALSVPIITYGVMFIAGVNLFQLNRYFIEEYSWNTENIEQVEVGMGKWVRDNIPANSSIAVTDAGAVRFWSRPDHRIIDFQGLNSYRCIGRPAAELMNQFKPNYVVFFRSLVTDQTLYNELVSFKAKRNTVLGGNELVALKVQKLPPWP